MRILKALIVVLVVGGIAVGAAGCGVNSAATTTPATKQVKVTVGTITNEVTGTATLAFAKTQDLAFEMAGTVDQILVQASDTVTKGEKVATLDTTAQEDTIHSLQESVNSAQRNLSNKQFALNKAQRVDTSSLTNAQFALTKANREVETRQLAKNQADLNLLAAQNTLANVSAVSDAQAAVDSINANIAYAQSAISGADAIRDPVLRSQWTDQLNLLNSQLKDANAKLASVLKGSGVSSTNVSIQIQQDAFAVQQAQKAVSDAQTSIDDAQIDIANAQLAVNNAQTAIDDAQVSIDNAKLDVQDAQQNLADAQTKLSEQQALSPIITAPFDGFITKIVASGGDVIQKGSVAMSIADPTQFEASFMVSETDIFSVKIGQAATVSVDALSGMTFPAKVTAIAPLATVSSGVVNYNVTAELTSLVPVGSGALSSAAFGSGGFGSGTFPSGANRTNLPSGLTGGTRPSGIPTGLPSGFPTTRPSGAPSASDNGTATRTVTATPVALKQGLSATVNIIIQQKSNVLVVPVRAVTTVAGKSTVQVVNGTTTETVTVTTGLSDATNIEITSGLTEGQTVVVKATGTSSSSPFGPGGGGAIRIP